MKFCTNCGTQLVDEAVICVNCGCPADMNAARNSAHARNLLNTLSERVKISGIIWIIVGALQLLSGVFFIVGVLNIISAMNDLKFSKEVLNNPRGIVERYEPMTSPIIVLVYNLIFGGVIGVAGSLYYFFAIRGFVMDNKVAFRSMS